MSATNYPLKSGLTSILASAVSDMYYSSFSSITKSNLQLFFLDYVAAAHAGYRANKQMNDIVYEVSFEHVTEGKSHVFFSDEPTSPLSAAFVNAFYAHGADMDDGNKLAAGHIGVHVISALMALAEERGIAFGEFYASMAVGYEVFCRLSSACMPYLVERGFHSTGTAGALASAAACARLLRLDAEGVENALSLSATQSSGLLLAGETRQDMKALNPANAARVGVFSALLVEKGAKGPLNPLESDKGWFHAMTPTIDMNRLLDGLGERYCIDQSYLKPYPSCRHTHCAIEAAIAIGEEVSFWDLERIEVITYGHAIELAGQIDLPTTIGEAKFSIKYAVAVALVKKHFGLDDLSLCHIDDNAKTLVKRIVLSRDDSYERPEDGIRGACLVAVTKDGDIIRKEVLVPKGEPENPFSYEDLDNKFISCFSNDAGDSDAENAVSFLNWYKPIISDPNNTFVFPRREARP